MRVFVTGATGFVGSHVVRELIAGGHKVLGLARSDAGARTLATVGADLQRGALEDLESLKSGAAASDAVIHLGFNNDYSKFIENCKIDEIAIEALGSVLTGSDRPLMVTTGLGGLAGPGQVATEDSVVPPDFPFPRVSEQVALALLSKGVRASVMRLPQVHNTVKQALITSAIAVAREKGISAYVGDGMSGWAAAHVSDVARLYRLALEKNEAGAKYHAIAEEGVRWRDIAETIGQGLKVPVVSIAPEEAPGHFGWWGRLASDGLRGLQRHNKEKAWLDPERAGTDSRLGTGGLLPGCIRPIMLCQCPAEYGKDFSETNR